MIRILCYGDSNTWGYIPATNHQRYSEKERWTKLLGKKLGKNYEIIEEGLCSRTLCSEYGEEEKKHKNGNKFLQTCLETHDKFDVFILMLGSNDLKKEFNNSAENVFSMFKKYVEYLVNFRSRVDGLKPKIIVSGLPIIQEDRGKSSNADIFLGVGKTSVELNNKIKQYCLMHNITYIDNDDLEVGLDGVHLTSESHFILSQKLYKIIKDIK